MKQKVTHTNHGEPHTIQMSEPCFDDRSAHYGFVAHDNKTTWTKPLYTQPNERSQKNMYIIAVIVVLLVIALVVGIFFACTRNTETEDNISSPAITSSSTITPNPEPEPDTSLNVD